MCVLVHLCVAMLTKACYNHRLVYPGAKSSGVEINHIDVQRVPVY